MIQSEQKGGGHLRSKMKELVALRERQTGARIHQKDIVEATKLNPNTVSRWMSPEPISRIEETVVIPLCRFFNCELGDLVYIDYD